MDATEVRDELLRSETALATRDPSGVEGGLMSLIAEEFVEFGQSGRAWTANSIREVLDVPATGAVLIEDFDVALLAQGVALATYRISGPSPSNRSSIWILRDGRWRLRFHQGTPRRR